MIKKLAKKIFSQGTDNLAAAAFLIGSFSFLSRIIGVFRDRILAQEFGAGDILDTYYAAFRLPDLIFNLLVLGALSAGFIPLFTSLLSDHSNPSSEKNKEAWLFTSRVFNIIGVALIVISLIALIFAKQVALIVAPGFSPEKINAVANLTRVMFLSPLFLGLSSVFGGVLQSFKKFFVYSLSPIMYNLGIIFGALFLAPRFGTIGLAFGVVIGAFSHFMIQMLMAFKLGFRPHWGFGFKDIKIKSLGLTMIPRTLSLAVTQINLTVITILASRLQSGSLAIINFSTNLVAFPVGIFGISFATAAFPKISACAHDCKKIVASFSEAARQIFFFILPSSVLLLILRAQIIRVVFGAGAFDWQATITTINVLGFMSFGIFAQALIPLLTRMFYAQGNSRTPFFLGLISDGTNLILALWLSATSLGASGLALAFSISSILNFSMLWVVLWKKIGFLDQTRIIKSVAIFSVSSIACGLAAQLSKIFVGPLVNMEKTLGIFTQGAVAGVFGLIAYFGFCALLGSEEFFSLWRSIKNRLPSKKIDLGDQGEARGI